MEKDYLEELFEGLGDVTVRRLFGVYGVYRRGLLFGLMSDGSIYLKTGPGNLDDFLSRGLPPFEYARKGKRVNMSFHRVPDELPDDPELAAAWGMRAFREAERAASAEADRGTGRGK